uniref:(California timema) hypothetical protein n=1 Tax=Timema californicum TaxID=61474 RepID=A0A7R9P2N3_TIMCA|nr:unnamed protein product [Timema californicum]
MDREIERATKVLLDLLVFWSPLEPITEILGGPDLFINKGSTINLTCLVKFAPEPPPAMLWSHKREVKEGFENHIDRCWDRRLNPGAPAQKSDTLPLDRQSTITVNVYVTRVIHLSYLCSLRMIHCVDLRYLKSGFTHPLVGQSDPLTGHAGPLTSQAGSYTGHASIHTEHTSPITKHDCPYTGHSGPLTRHTDSYTGHAGPHIGDATPLHSPDTMALTIDILTPSLDMSYSLGIGSSPASSELGVLTLQLTLPTPPSWDEQVNQEGERADPFRVINFDSPRGGISLVTEKGPVTTSRLLIQKAIPTDTGLYTCDPSNANPASVTVHILNGEHPAAMHHGKATTLRCPPPSALVVIATWMLVIHEI